VPLASGTTPENQRAETLKTGAEAWKERRALLSARGAAARARGQAPSDRAAQRIQDQQRQNLEREATQLRSMNGGRTQRRARG
jgi:hypothetical protein